MDILCQRLHNQHLIGQKFKHPEEVVKSLGAVQAQDFPAAKWSVGLRMRHATDEIVEKAYNDGRILRTHVMRPTWHFVLPEDIHWMQELTAFNVKKLMGHYNRKLELDEALFKKSNTALLKALKGHNYLTRLEIKKLLERIGIKTDVQRLAHIVMWAELDALICSGPLRLRPVPYGTYHSVHPCPEPSAVRDGTGLRSGQAKGKQFTYALLEERVPKYKKLDRDEALATLSLTYFTSHGPAQLKDFSWWSGLSIKEATEGLDFIKAKTIQETVHGKVYWFIHRSSTTYKPHPTAFLLSVYDEYFIGYSDRSDMLEEKYKGEMAKVGNALLTSLIILNGKVEGTWKRTLKKQKVEIQLNLFRRFATHEKELIKSQTQSFAAFLGLTAVLV